MSLVVPSMCRLVGCYSPMNITRRWFTTSYVWAKRKFSLERRIKPLSYLHEKSSYKAFSTCRLPQQSRFVEPAMKNVTDGMYAFLLTRPVIKDDLWHNIAEYTGLENAASHPATKSVWPVSLLLKITSNWPHGDPYGLKLCESLMCYMKSSKTCTVDNIIVWSSYIAFMSFYLGTEGITEEKIFDLLEEKVGHFSLPEPTIMQRLISIYCNTSQWEKGVELARGLPEKMSCVKCFQFVTIETLKRKEYDIALEFIERTLRTLELDMIRTNKSGYIVMDETVVKTVLEAANVDEYVLFNVLEQMEAMKIHLTDSSAKDVKEWFQRKWRWDGAMSEVIRINGQCRNCSHKLKEIEELDAESLKELCGNYRKTLFTGNYNIHLLSSTGELDRFDEFLADMEPVDVVMDGLSVLLSRGKISPQLLVNTLKHITTDLGLKVLVLGRRHMIHSNKAVFEQLQKHAQIFLVENKTKDDPFMLYAAMHQGPKTFFISNDLMRDHLFFVGETLGDLENRRFRTWMKTRKVPFILKAKLPYLHLLWPSTVDICAQRTEHTIHIPYVNGMQAEDNFIKYNQNYPRTMLCLTKPGIFKYTNSARKHRQQRSPTVQTWEKDIEPSSSERTKVE